MELTSKDEAWITKHLQISGIEVPSQAAQSITTRMKQLQGECTLTAAGVHS
jgi:hypothetical protein